MDRRTQSDRLLGFWVADGDSLFVLEACLCLLARGNRYVRWWGSTGCS